MDESKKYIEMYQKAKKAKKECPLDCDPWMFTEAKAEDKLNLIKLFYDFCGVPSVKREKCYVRPYEIFNSIEQLWLAFLMRFKYGKYWDNDRRRWRRRCFHCNRNLKDGDDYWGRALETICAPCLKKESPRIRKFYETVEREAKIKE